MLQGESTEVVPSTTFGWRKVKMSPAPNGQEIQPAAGRRWRHLPSVRARDGIHATLKLRGGAEGWVEVRARGSVGRYHGATGIYDVLMEVAEGAAYWAQSQRKFEGGGR